MAATRRGGPGARAAAPSSPDYIPHNAPRHGLRPPERGKGRAGRRSGSGVLGARRVQSPHAGSQPRPDSQAPALLHPDLPAALRARNAADASSAALAAPLGLGSPVAAATAARSPQARKREGARERGKGRLRDPARAAPSPPRPRHAPRPPGSRNPELGSGPRGGRRGSLSLSLWCDSRGPGRAGERASVARAAGAERGGWCGLR